MTAARLLEWPIPPEDGYYAEDLDRIPDLPPHTELIDGSLVFVSAQTLFHMVVIDGLKDELRRQAPDELAVIREMTMTLAPRQRPEPDISIVAKSAIRSLAQTDLPFEESLLVVEVVSKSSEILDRERKPQLYAVAGIPCYWRVEREETDIAVHVHELGADGAYHVSGVHRGRLEVSRPFPIIIDLAAITEPFARE